MTRKKLSKQEPESPLEDLQQHQTISEDLYKLLKKKGLPFFAMLFGMSCIFITTDGLGMLSEGFSVKHAVPITLLFPSVFMACSGITLICCDIFTIFLALILLLIGDYSKSDFANVVKQVYKLKKSNPDVPQCEKPKRKKSTKSKKARNK